MRRILPLIVSLVLAVLVLGYALSSSYRETAATRIERDRPASVATTLRGELADSSVPAQDEHATRLATRHPSSTDFDAASEPALDLYVRVVDPMTREPLVGASAGASDGPLAIPFHPIWSANAGGVVRARLRDSVGRGLVINAPGRLPVFVLPRHGHSTLETALVIPLARCWPKTIRVLDPGGDPVQDVVVRLGTGWWLFALRPMLPGEDATTGIEPPEWTARTNELGEARFECLPGSVIFTGSVLRSGVEIWRANWFALPTMSTDPIAEWRIGTACSIRGRASEVDGSPAVGVPIALDVADRRTAIYFGTGGVWGRRIATTDEHGRFEFEFVDSGGWWMGPVRDPSTVRTEVVAPDFACFGQPLHVPIGTKSVDVEVRVERGLWIRGRVVDPDGAGSAALLTLASVDGRVTSDWRADSRGDFELGPLVAGECELRAEDTRRKFSRSSVLRVSPGASGVVVALRRPGSVRVVVRDARTREPVPGSVGLLMSADGERHFEPFGTRTDALEFTGLEPGTYSIAVTTDDGRCGGIESLVLAEREHRSDVEVEVEPGAMLSLRNRDAVAALELEIWRGGVCFGLEGLARDGDISLRVPAGLVTVRARAGSGSLEYVVEVDLSAGSTRELVFDRGWK